MIEECTKMRQFFIRSIQKHVTSDFSQQICVEVTFKSDIE